jgi:hypothetical protein
MKNCFPSLVKNLFPVAVMVGRALAVTAPATAENQESLILAITRQTDWSDRNVVVYVL